MAEDTRSQSEGAQPGLGCLLRLFWMAFGNAALLFAAFEVARSEHIGTPDALYALVVVALLVARYIDVTRFNGMTAYAAPATRAHLRRYALVLVNVALFGWLLARYVGATMS
jgi:hypothetical protein